MFYPIKYFLNLESYLLFLIYNLFLNWYKYQYYADLINFVSLL